ncbi:MAG: hypothetical protein ABIL58_01115 [Pseudomonadota bacterium]
MNNDLKTMAGQGVLGYVIFAVALVCTIVSELAFTFYISNYGLSNLHALQENP